MCKYVVTIQTSPQSQYQTYRGWDQLHDTRKQANQCAMRARQVFMSARVETVKLAKPA